MAVGRRCLICSGCPPRTKSSPSTCLINRALFLKKSEKTLFLELQGAPSQLSSAPMTNAGAHNLSPLCIFFLYKSTCNLVSDENRFYLNLKRAPLSLPSRPHQFLIWFCRCESASIINNSISLFRSMINND